MFTKYLLDGSRDERMVDFISSFTVTHLYIWTLKRCCGGRARTCHVLSLWAVQSYSTPVEASTRKHMKSASKTGFPFNTIHLESLALFLLSKLAVILLLLLISWELSLWGQSPCYIFVSPTSIQSDTLHIVNVPSSMFRQTVPRWSTDCGNTIKVILLGSSAFCISDRLKGDRS